MNVKKGSDRETKLLKKMNLHKKIKIKVKIMNSYKRSKEFAIIWTKNYCSKDFWGKKEKIFFLLFFFVKIYCRQCVYGRIPRRVEGWGTEGFSSVPNIPNAEGPKVVNFYFSHFYRLLNLFLLYFICFFLGTWLATSCCHF